MRIILFFFILLYTLPGCDIIFDSNNTSERIVTIKGKVVNSCTNQPVQDIVIYFKALMKGYKRWHKISSKIKTNADGQFTFSGSLENVQGAIYVAVNHEVNLELDEDYYFIREWDRPRIDSLYSIYRFKTFLDISKIIMLPPRKPVNIVAKPDTLESRSEFNYIRINESFTGTSTGPQSVPHSIYYSDSLNILLAADMEHSCSVKFLRDNNEEWHSQKLKLDCSDSSKFVIRY